MMMLAIVLMEEGNNVIIFDKIKPKEAPGAFLVKN